MQGTITRLLIERGFGFIRRADGGDVFFHVRDLAADLQWDETLTERRVRFSVVADHKGPRAIEVRTVD